MKRPILLRLLPDRLSVAACARLYRGPVEERWSPLYQGASLRHAPQVTMDVLPGDVISDCIAFTGVYEPALTRRVADLARVGGTLVEVGANLGYFSLLWAAAGPENKVVAFEPSPRNIAMFRRNILRNGRESQIELHPAAAGQAKGTLRFDPGPEEQTGWGGLLPSGSGEGIEVAVVRVDDVVAPDAPVALLKVDTEGADAWALMGCERLLAARAVREVWFEQNKPRIRALGLSPDAAQDYLRSVGYSCRARGDSSADVVEWTAVPADSPSHSRQAGVSVDT